LFNAAKIKRGGEEEGAGGCLTLQCRLSNVKAEGEKEEEREGTASTAESQEEGFRDSLMAWKRSRRRMSSVDVKQRHTM